MVTPIWPLVRKRGGPFRGVPAIQRNSSCFHSRIGGRFNAIDPQSINTLYYKSSQFFYQQWHFSNQTWLPSTFSSLPSDVWLALELNSKLFEAFVSLSKKTDKVHLQLFNIQGHFESSREIKTGAWPCHRHRSYHPSTWKNRWNT